MPLPALRRKLAAAALAVALFASLAVPLRAARILPDTGKWDNYFALFARNSAVPWKRVSLRLDTYSGASVDFAAYAVDPADVLVAGANSRPRAIDTSHLQPVARWKFTPPPGLTFESNDVEVPLQNREGFFVIEARRGAAVQQVWLNLSRIGLIAKESPAGSLLYGADLSSGRALAAMRISYVVDRQFVVAKTDAHGLSHVPARAVFALAEWGRSKAWVSLYPQSPPPGAVVAVRADRAAVRAGESVRVIGYARRRDGNTYRPAAGEVALSLAVRGRTLATTRATLDRAGAFTTAFAIPPDAPAGSATILANAAGASGGATIQVEGSGDVALAIAASCTTACPSDAPIALTVTARRAGLLAAGQAVAVQVVRSPHVFPPGTALDSPAWGVTQVVDETLTTDATGVIRLTLPAPSDGLPSTYGVSAGAGAATASTDLIAPNARLALLVVPDADAIDASEPAGFTVRGYDPLAGTPAAGATVRVQLSHGPTVQTQTVTLDAEGAARVTFRNVALGMNLAEASTTLDGRDVRDVAAVTVSLDAQGGGSTAGAGDLHISLDRTRYKPGDRVAVSANLPGALGDALITMETVRGAATTVAATANGSASATLSVPETTGAVAVGVAFVRDGALVTGTLPLAVDGPGHERLLALTADRASYAPGATARVSLADGGDTTGATLAVRLGDRQAAAGASFEDVSAILNSNGTTTQNTASTDPAWHTWVAPAQSKALDIFGDDRPRQSAAQAPELAADAARVLVWNVNRADGGTFDVTLPQEPGRYVLGVVKITDDGDVGSASIALTVQ